MTLVYRKELEERVDDFLKDPGIATGLAITYNAGHVLDFALGYFAGNLVDYAVLLSDHYKTDWTDEEMAEVTDLLNRRKYEMLDAVQRELEKQRTCHKSK